MMSNSQPIEEVFTNIASSELPSIFKLLWDYGKEFISAKDFFAYSKKYKEGLEQDLSFTQILGMERPVPLDEIYTEVHTLASIESRQYVEIEELKKTKRKEIEERSFERIENDVFQKLIQQYKTINLGARIVAIEDQYAKEIEPLKRKRDETIDARTESLNSKIGKVEEGPNWQKEIDALRERYQKELEIITNSFSEECEPILQRKRDDIRQATESFENLREEELSQIRQGLPDAVEKEIQKEVRIAINRILLNDSDAGTDTKSLQRPGWEVVAPKDRVVVLGKPGAGKTTFFKHITLRHLRDQVSTPKLPIFVTLKEFVDSGYEDVFDFIVDSFKDCGFPNARPFLERVLHSQQECIFLFDGLDEVPKESQQDVVSMIIKLSKRYRLNQFLVSCRVANYKGQLEGFTEVQIADFNINQVTKFVKGWFQESHSDAVNFLVELKHNPGLQELTSTPLLLALLCITYKRNQKFPDQKSLLYLACVDALFIDWDSSRQIRRDNFVEKFDVESKKQLLAKVACDTFCEEIQFFSQEEIVTQFNQNSITLPIPLNSGVNILKEFVQHHGLIVEQAKNLYSFSHLTFQEFFTALHLSHHQSTSLFEKVSNEIWKEPRWHEVVILLSGLLSSADTLIVCLRNTAKSHLKVPVNLHGQLMEKQLPDSANTYISKYGSSENEINAWEAWFRSKLCESKWSPYVFSPLVVQLFELDRKSKHDLSMSRPLKVVLDECLSDKYFRRTRPDLQGNKDTVENYFRFVKLILEILNSKVRVTPSLVSQVVIDMLSPNSDTWDYPTSSLVNKLGV